MKKGMGILATLALFAAVYVGAKVAGSATGKTAAIQEVEKEAISARVPSQLFGAKWLMSMDQVEALRPSIRQHTSDALIENQSYLGREANILYTFSDDALVMVIVTFLGRGSVGSYAAVQAELERQYSPMSAPRATTRYVLFSEKTAPRFKIQHLLSEPLGVPTEQVLFYRTK